MSSSKSPSKSTIISHYFIPLIISVGVFLFFQWFLILGSACFHCSSALGGIICASPPLMVGVWGLTRTDDGGESPASSQMMWSDVGSGRGPRMPAAVGVWPWLGLTSQRGCRSGFGLPFRVDGGGLGWSWVGVRPHPWWWSVWWTGFRVMVWRSAQWTSALPCWTASAAAKQCLKILNGF